MERIIITLGVCVCIIAGFLLIPTISATDTATLVIKIHKIAKEDPVGSWIDGSADWSYRLWIDDGQTTQDSGWIKCAGDTDNPVVNLNYQYSIANSQIFLKIALKNSNVVGEVLADISGDSGDGVGSFTGSNYGVGARYEGTWDLTTDTLTGDQTNIVTLSGNNYYWTSGSFDGSDDEEVYDASLWFNISDTYNLPVAIAGSDQTVDAGDKVNFNGGSSAAAVTITRYQWDFESDGVWDAEGETTSYTFNTAGTYTVTLKVTDSLDKYATNTCTVTVRTKPFAAFVYNPKDSPHPTTLDTIQFSDTSTIIGGTLTAWQWNFGDGTTSTDRNPTHKYSQGSTYTVTLRITANDGQQSTNYTSFTVVEMANIVGTVEDVDGNPISGAAVKLYSVGSSSLLDSTTTDSMGRYTISEVVVKKYDVEASKSGYENNKNSNKQISSGDNTIDFVLTVPTEPTPPEPEPEPNGDNGTPGFELILVFCAIALILFTHSRKRN